jgi:hypothetical protein
MSGVAVGGLRGLASKAGLLNDLLPDQTPPDHPLMGHVILPVGSSEATLKVVRGWISEAACSETGIFMGADKTIRIVGGPTAYVDEAVEYQFLENTEAFTIIH